LASDHPGGCLQIYNITCQSERELQYYPTHAI
jgi:hypothetical protein